jgi:phosphoglycerate dehydrogenase-like enzyme
MALTDTASTREPPPLVWLPYPPEELEGLPAGLRYEEVVPGPGGEVPPSAAEVELVVLPYRFSRVDAAMLAGLPRLRVVQSQSAGTEHLAPFIPEGVRLCSGRGIHSSSTAELVLTLVLASLRGVPDFVRAQDAGRWQPGWRPALADSRVLVVGYGDIGQAVERRLAPFEVEVVRVARTARDGVHGFDELPSLLPHVDVVVLLVPLTDETRAMVDAEFLGAMRRGALLVNVARGAVVDTDALVVALRDGQVTAALDVTDPEPLPVGHPLWGCPGLLVTPHVGGASSAMEPRARALVRDQLTRFARGEELVNVITGAY